VIKTSEDKSIKSGKIFWGWVHIKETSEQLKTRWSISWTCNPHREHMKQREIPFFSIHINRQTHMQKIPKHHSLSRGIKLDQMILP